MVHPPMEEKLKPCQEKGKEFRRFYFTVGLMRLIRNTIGVLMRSK